MNNKFQQLLVISLASLRFLLASGLTQAGCRTIGAHWQNGRWYPTQTFCTGYRERCEWVSYYKYRGYRYGGHKVCFYR
jgi:hypothetical protein